MAARDAPFLVPKPIPAQTQTQSQPQSQPQLATPVSVPLRALPRAAPLRFTSNSGKGVLALSDAEGSNVGLQGVRDFIILYRICGEDVSAADRPLGISNSNISGSGSDSSSLPFGSPISTTGTSASAYKAAAAMAGPRAAMKSKPKICGKLACFDTFLASLAALDAFCSTERARVMVPASSPASLSGSMEAAKGKEKEKEIEGERETEAEAASKGQGASMGSLRVCLNLVLDTVSDTELAAYVSHFRAMQPHLGIVKDFKIGRIAHRDNSLTLRECLRICMSNANAASLSDALSQLSLKPASETQQTQQSQQAQAQQLQQKEQLRDHLQKRLQIAAQDPAVFSTFGSAKASAAATAAASAIPIASPMTTAVLMSEDDYVWMPDALLKGLEGLSLSPYATVYSHPDKQASFPTGAPRGPLPHFVDGGESGILWTSRRSFWHTTASTTMTFFSRMDVLIADAPHFLSLSEPGRPPMDYALWPLLREGAGRTLIHAVPAAATHAEVAWLAHGTDWVQVVRATARPASDV